MSVRLIVPGVPAPQGSLVRTKFGVRDANPATRPWRAAISAEAAAAMNGTRMLTGPVKVRAELQLPRSKSHYGTGRNAGVLKASAPLYCETKPDADKLARAIGDALTGIVFRDDSQIVMWEIVKRYGDPAGCVVSVEVAA